MPLLPGGAVPGLTDLVAKNSGAQPDRVAALSEPSSASTDLLAQLTDLHNQQVALAKSKEEVPTMRDDLLSPEGIMSMLGMIGGAASGSRDLAAGGAGLMKGFMGQGRGEAAQQMSSIQESEAALTQAMDAKRRQLTTMLQTRPEMFIDPETGKSIVDPRLLGMAATGYMIPINPAVNYTLQQKSLKKNTMIELGLREATTGDTPERRQAGVQILENAIGVKFPQDVLDAFASQDDWAIWEALLRMPGLLTANTLAAMNHWMENPDLSIRTSPILVGMLEPDITVSAGGTKYTVEDHYLQLLATWSQAYSINPGAYEGMSDTEQIDAIFGASPGDQALLKSKLDKDDPFGVGISTKDFQATIQSLGEWMFKFWELSEGKSKFFTDRGITSTEDLWNHATRIAVEMLPILEQVIKDNGSINRGRAMALMTDFYAGPDPTLGGYAIAASQARNKLDALVAEFTEDSVFNVEGFNRAVLEFINTASEE